jgi:hypothetical protein
MSTAMPRPKRTDPASPDEQVTISIRFPGRVYNELARLSDQERRSLAAQVLYIVERNLAEAARERGSTGRQEA